MKTNCDYIQSNVSNDSHTIKYINDNFNENKHGFASLTLGDSYYSLLIKITIIFSLALDTVVMIQLHLVYVQRSCFICPLESNLFVNFGKYAK